MLLATDRSERLFEAGLADRAEIVLRDYRDERGSYDGVASIELDHRPLLQGIVEDPSIHLGQPRLKLIEFTR